jgi:hypothetical protein
MGGIGTVLYVGTQKTAVASGSGCGAEPSTVMALDIGSGKTAGDFFRHDTPTPGEMENATMTVEDEVTRARISAVHHGRGFAPDRAARRHRGPVGHGAQHGGDGAGVRPPGLGNAGAPDRAQ